MKKFSAAALVFLASLGACSGPGTPDAGDPDTGASDAGTDTATPVDVMLANGCPVLTEPVARPGDPAGGDTFATFAGPFFAANCTRCHSTTRVTASDRHGAPDGFNWDDEASVRMHLGRIRNAVGVLNYMPIGDPNITCDERRRVVRWIDVGAP